MKEPEELKPSATTQARTYVRFAALGDSVTYGIGDPTAAGYRGWFGILIQSIKQAHDVSAINLAKPGALAADVLRSQLPEALSHRPTLASLVVGMNDALGAGWDAKQIRTDLLQCAAELDAIGTTLITFNLHDHSRLLPLPRALRRGLLGRLEELNAIYREIHATYGGIRVDLAAHPDVFDRDLWSVDRLHPSELGHRALAIEVAALLEEFGLDFPEPRPETDGATPTWTDQARWIAQKVLPWVAHHAIDFVGALGPAPSKPDSKLSALSGNLIERVTHGGLI